MNITDIPHLNNFRQGKLTPGEGLISVLIGNWVYGDDPWPQMTKQLQPHHFIREWESALWSILMAFRESDIIPELPALHIAAEGLRERYAKKPAVLAWLNEILISSQALSSQNVNFYAEMIAREWLEHKHATVEAETHAIDDAKERKRLRDEKLAEIEADPIHGRKHHKTAPELATILIDDWIARATGENKIKPIGFGYSSLDDVPFSPGNLAILAARSGMGKSTIALNLVRQLREGGTTCGIFTLEMTEMEMAKVIAAQVGRIDMTVFSKDNPTAEEEERAIEIFEEFAKQKLAIQDTPGLDLPTLDSGIKAMKIDYPDLRLVMIDHLHLMKEYVSPRKDQRSGLIELTGTIKTMAKKHNVGILLLAQLNRDCEKRDDKRPIMADLKESGSIEQDADIIMFVHRDSYYKDEGEPERPARGGGFKRRWDQVEDEPKPVDQSTQLLVRKNRHGNEQRMVKKFIVNPATKRAEMLGGH